MQKYLLKFTKRLNLNTSLIINYNWELKVYYFKAKFNPLVSVKKTSIWNQSNSKQKIPITVENSQCKNIPRLFLTKKDKLVLKWRCSCERISITLLIDILCFQFFLTFPLVPNWQDQLEEVARGQNVSEVPVQFGEE